MILYYIYNFCVILLCIIIIYVYHFILHDFLFRIFYFNHLIVFNNSLHLLHACIFVYFTRFDISLYLFYKLYII